MLYSQHELETGDIGVGLQALFSRPAYLHQGGNADGNF